jgi:hypothetical protein
MLKNQLSYSKTYTNEYRSKNKSVKSGTIKRHMLVKSKYQEVKLIFTKNLLSTTKAEEKWHPLICKLLKNI